MNIWKYQTTITHRLLIWSLLSMVVGTFLQISQQRFARGLGQQFALWGFIDALIAFFGNQSAKKRLTQIPDPGAPEVTKRETFNLRRLLWINVFLDVGYVVGGLALALTKGKTNVRWRGHGFGVIIQGGFLFFFDLLHALKIEKLDSSPHRNLYP